MHIAKVVRKYKDREYVSFLLRRSFREGGRVRHETLANLSALPPAGIDAVRAVLAGEVLVAAGEAVAVERSLPHGHVAAVWAMARELGLARAGPGPRARGGTGMPAGFQAGHDALVADDHARRGLGHRRGYDRRRVRRHGLAPRPPGRYRGHPRPPAPGPGWQGALRPVELLGGREPLPSRQAGVLPRREGGQGPGGVRPHLRP